MKPSSRKIVHRSPAHTVRLLNLPHLQPEAIEADSSVERDFVHCAALFPATTSISSQPFKLTLLAGTYTPDYLVVFRDGSRAVVEVKPEEFIENFQEKFDQARRKLAKFGMSFLLARDTVLRRDRLAERALFVRRYAKGGASLNDINRCIEILRSSNGVLSMKELYEAGISRSTIFFMVTRRQLHLGADLQYGDDAQVQLFEQPDLGESHAIRFANWLDA